MKAMEENSRCESDATIQRLVASQLKGGFIDLLSVSKRYFSRSHTSTKVEIYFDEEDSPRLINLTGWNDNAPRLTGLMWWFNRNLAEVGDEVQIARFSDGTYKLHFLKSAKVRNTIPIIEKTEEIHRCEEIMKGTDIADLVRRLFSSHDILEKSGAKPERKSHCILSSNEIQNELEKRYSISAKAKGISSAIESSGIIVDSPTTGGRRHLELVKMGLDLYGLNTETNTREVLSRYLRSLGYDVMHEFTDEVDNLRLLLTKGVSGFCRKENTRDLLAIKKQGFTADIWLVELKGHSAAEDWDFWMSGFEQINRIIAFREQALSEIEENFTFQCSCAVPGFPAKLHNYDHCYSKEMEFIRKAMANCRVRLSKSNIHFFNAIKNGFLERLNEPFPIFHFLLVRGENDVVDFFSGKQFSEFLVKA